MTPTIPSELLARLRRLTMPNGEILVCEYPNDAAWAKSWSIIYPDTGRIGTTGEQDWEIVERYGLTAIIEALSPKVSEQVAGEAIAPEAFARNLHPDVWAKYDKAQASPSVTQAATSGIARSLFEAERLIGLLPTLHNAANETQDADPIYTSPVLELRANTIGRVEVGQDDPLYKAFRPSPETIAAIEKNEAANAQGLAAIRDMMVGHVTNWPEPKRFGTAIALIDKTLHAALSSPPTLDRERVAAIVARAYGGSLYPGLGTPGDYPVEDVDYRAADAILALIND